MLSPSPLRGGSFPVQGGDNVDTSRTEGDNVVTIPPPGGEFTSPGGDGANVITFSLPTWRTVTTSSPFQPQGGRPSRGEVPPPWGKGDNVVTIPGDVFPSRGGVTTLSPFPRGGWGGEVTTLSHPTPSSREGGEFHSPGGKATTLSPLGV